MSETVTVNTAGPGGASTAPWTNWSGKLRAPAGASLHHVRSEADAAALAAATSGAGKRLRVAGAGHSHMPLVPTDGVIADLSGLSGVISTDAASQRAWVWAGTPIHALGRPLHDAGLALVNQGDIDRQAIGGATGTGTHGTGRTLRNLSSAVVGARVALASGELVDTNAGERPELFQAIRLNLGALGIVTRLELQLRSAYRLRERGFVAPLGEVVDRLDELADVSRHAEMFWYPTRDRAVVKVIDETDDEPEYPVGPEGQRCAWSYEVLPSHRDWRHSEIEYSVPAEAGPACFAAIRAMLAREFPTMGWPVEYRTLAADDVWLSTAHERPTVTISLHLPAADDDEPLFRAAEQVFRDHDGRPHWAKVHYLDGATLAAIHPAWARWWAVRDGVDPSGTFLNDFLRTIRP
ncbi:MAG: D-arabinono-1,4-lactone oxidase [Acidimicrobiales bacterium]